MNALRRIYALAIKEFIHLRRDWWLPAFMLLGGALELTLVAWATSRPIVNLPLMVVDDDRTAASRQLVAALENTTTFAPPYFADNLDEARAALDRGRVTAVVLIPHGFQAQMTAPDGRPRLAVLLDGADSPSALAARRAVEGLVARLDQRIALQRLGLPETAFSGFAPSIRVWFNEKLSDEYYTAPAELGLMLEFTVMIFAALAFARERELGTMEQLLVMPFSSLEIILGKAIPAAIIGFVDFLILLGMMNLVFELPVRGSLTLLLIIAAVYLLVELAKGMMISVAAHTQQQAFLLVLLVGMVDFMFTGYAAPVETMPPALQWLSNLVPAHHWLTILRGILLKGADLTVLWPHVAALLALGLVIGTVSLRYVRRALD